ncbi:unnamed protein product [Alopecurus aequalis]
MSTPPADYPSSVFSPELQPKEHVLLLYPHHIDEGSALANTKPIGGDNWILNWAVYDGPTASAKLVARLQGLYYTGGNSTVDLVFTDERFPSTLKFAGNINNTNEMAILGGTGEFALAQGIVKTRNFVPTSFRIREFHIRAMVPTLGKPVPTPVTITKDGPWGGNDGEYLDVTDLPLRLESVTIGSGDVVDSLAYSYIDQAGNYHIAGKWGGDGGLKKTIQLAPTETVTKIVGTTGDFEGHTVITSMSIATNLSTYGPFGKEKGNGFSTAAVNNIIVGFYVRAGVYVNGLGVYIRKN